MPKPHTSFTSKYDRLFPVLINDVSISQPCDENQVPNSTLVQYKAIYDTGATKSAISQKVVNECKLQPTGIVEVNTAGGKHPCETYLVNIYLPNRVGFTWVTVTKASLIVGADILIGMDILLNGDFAVSNYEGKTTFSFRVPSCECIDFVAQPYKEKPAQASPKIGRNDPCSCGSGKKYKNCCGKIA